MVVDVLGAAGLVDFRMASTAAASDQLDRDLAAGLAAAALVVGAGARPWPRRPGRCRPTPWPPPCPSCSGRRSTRWPSAPCEDGSRCSRTSRTEGAAAAGVEVPKLIEPRRVSWVNLLLVVGTLVGGWALIGVLVNVTKSWSTITGAKWGWVAAVVVLAQAAYPAIAITTVGSVTNPLPFGRTWALELADTFVALAGGSMAVLATRVRFFQQEGYDGTLAVSSGVLVSTASWIVKGGALPHLPSLRPRPAALHQEPVKRVSGGTPRWSGSSCSS